MKKDRKKITDSEREVLELLWNSDEPLTSTEIVRLCVGRTWKSSYIHIMINSLLKKEMIKVAGFKKTTKNYARTFEPTMTRDQWNLFQMKQEKGVTAELLKEMLEMIITEGADEEVLEELFEVIEKRKEELRAVS